MGNGFVVYLLNEKWFSLEERCFDNHKHHVVLETNLSISIGQTSRQPIYLAIDTISIKCNVYNLYYILLCMIWFSNDLAMYKTFGRASHTEIWTLPNWISDGVINQRTTVLGRFEYAKTIWFCFAYAEGQIIVQKILKWDVNSIGASSFKTTTLSLICTYYSYK